MLKKKKKTKIGGCHTNSPLPWQIGIHIWDGQFDHEKPGRHETVWDTDGREEADFGDEKTHSSTEETKAGGGPGKIFFFF